MNKYISAVLTVTLIAAMLLTPVSFADNAAEAEKILLTVKERISIPEEFSEFEYNSETRGGVTYYFFRWYPKDGKEGDISVTCDSYGTITSYNEYNSYRYKDDPSFPTVSREQAKAAAEDFIKRINPETADNIEIRNNQDTYDDLYSSSYYFTLVRVENGYPLMDSQGNISVDSDKGIVTNYYMDWWQGVDFATGSVLGAEEAVKAYKDMFGMKLVYKMSDNKVYLAYMKNDEGGKFIDALTGEVFEKTGYFEGPYASANKEMGFDSAAGGLTGQEISKIEEIAGLISASEAEKIARGNKYVGISGEAKVEYSNLYKYGLYDEYTYSLQFSSGSEYWNVSVNAKTGAITGFYSYSNDKYDLPGDKLTAERTVEIAKDVMKSTMGSIADEYSISNSVDKGTVSFTRLVNGIEYVDNTGYISIGNDEKIRNFRYTYTKDSFPAPGDVITADTACEYLLDGNYNIYYSADYGDTNAEWGIAPKKARLVYVAEGQYSIIDPYTGEFLDYSGKPEENSGVIKEYTDIEGHYAQAQIEALARAGAGFDGGQFFPDRPILQKEYISLLVSVFNRWYGVYPLYDEAALSRAYTQASSMGIITEEERESEAVITREASAKFFIRALNMDKYAQMDEIYNCPFPDVTQYKGHVSLLYGLGIVGGDQNGNFNPQNELSRADAAIMIYNYLSK